MTDDEVFFAAVCMQFGRKVPAPTAPDTGGFLVGAVIKKPYLILAGVKSPSRPDCSFDARRSNIFELSNRSAAAVSALHTEVTRFVQARRIERIFLRASTVNGKFTGHPLNFKIEAALQMVPALEVTFVTSASVSAWIRGADPEVPDADEGLGAALAAKQRQAIETALFTAHNYGRTKCFCDGSTGNV